jgi:excisionase family DNA binding protein
VNFPQKMYYRVEEVAAYFDISRTTVYRLIKREMLKAVKIRSSLRINRQELDRFARKNLKRSRRKTSETK